MKNILNIILLTTFTSAFGQSVHIAPWEIIAKKVKSVTVTYHFQWHNGVDIKEASNTMDISYYDTTGSIVKLIEYDPYSETQTEFIYNQNNQLTGTKRNYKFIGISWGCFPERTNVIKTVTKYDKRYGRVKSETTIYIHHNLPRSMVKLNYFYNAKGLLDRKVYASDKDHRYIQIKYEYYE